MHHPPLTQALKHYNRHGRHRFHVPAHAGNGEKLGGTSFLNDPYRYDLTELDGLDVLSDPEGCLADAQASIATIFNVAHSFLLVNGATVGIEAALLASLKPGDKVLLPRNVHRSVVSGLVLTDAQPIWFLPERLSQWGLWGAVSVESIEAELEKQADVKALVITSPTYEGIGSDIESIATLCRNKNVLLIIDEAHGSLWPLSNRLPQSAAHTHADCVIHSIHKSAGCLTQGALAHLPHHSRISSVAYQQALNLLQTTSPSYLLMASIEACCHFWNSQGGQTRLNTWLDQVLELRAQIPSKLKKLLLFNPELPPHPAPVPTDIHIRLFRSGVPKALRATAENPPQEGGGDNKLYKTEEDLSKKVHLCDPSKLYWIHPQIQGDEWGATFEEELKLAYESASPYGVLYLMNPGLESGDFKTFACLMQEGEALLTRASFEEKTDMPGIRCPCVGGDPLQTKPKNPILVIGSSLLMDPRLRRDDVKQEPFENNPLAAMLDTQNPAILLPEIVLSPREAFFSDSEHVETIHSIGRIAHEMIVRCPPGIPVLMPGERISEAHVPFLPEYGIRVVSQ